MESARTYDGTCREFKSLQCRINIRSHVHYRAYDYSGPLEFSGSRWHDTENCVEKVRLVCDAFVCDDVSATFVALV